MKIPSVSGLIQVEAGKMDTHKKRLVFSPNRHWFYYEPKKVYVVEPTAPQITPKMTTRVSTGAKITE